MGEATLEKLGEWIEAGRWVAAQLRKDMREHPEDHPNEDPRALSLVATKLDEAELWLTKVRT